MSDRSVRVALYGEDKGVGKMLDKTGEHAESMSARVGSSMSRMGAKLGGEMGEMLNQAGEGLDKLGEHGKTAAGKLQITGAAVTGLGVVLDRMGAADKAATEGLDTAITNTGQSVEEYSGRIEEAIEKQEGFGHQSEETSYALQILTQAYNDPAKALDKLQMVSDVAAARHIKLADAANMVAQAMAGNTRTLKQFGITVGKNADGTADLESALDELAQKVNGQAAASVDNFTGRLDVMKTKAEETVQAFSATVGAVLTAVGPALMGVGTIIQSGVVPRIGAMVKGWFTASDAATTASAASVTAATAEASAVDVASGEIVAAKEATAVAATVEADAIATSGADIAAAETVAASDVVASEAAMASASVATAGTFRASMAAINSSSLLMSAGVGAALVAGMMEWQSYEQATKKATAGAQEEIGRITSGANTSSIAGRIDELRDLQKSLDEASQHLGGIGGVSFSDPFHEMSQVNSQRALIAQADAYTSALDRETQALVRMGSNERTLTAQYGISRAELEALAKANSVDLSGSLEDVEKGFGSTIPAAAAAAKQYGMTVDATLSLAGAHKVDLTKGIDAATSAFDDLHAATVPAGQAEVALREDAKVLGDAWSSAKDKADAFSDAIRQIVSPALSAHDKELKLADAIADLSGKLKAGKHALDDNTAAGRANLEAYDDIISQALDAADAKYKETGSIDDAVSVYQRYVGQLEATAQAQGISRAKTDAYLRSVGGSVDQLVDRLGDAVPQASRAGDISAHAMLDRLSSEIRHAGPNVSSAVVTLYTETARRVADDAAGAGKTIGQQMTAGIASGVLNPKTIRQMEGAVESVANKVTDVFRGVLGIHSPSQVFADLGREIPAGAAVGIRAGAGDVNDAVAHMVDIPSQIGGGHAGPRAGGGDVHIHLQPTFGTNADDAAREVAAALERWSGGGNVLRVKVAP